MSFAEVQHKKCPLFYLFLWWWKAAAGCNCICFIEGVCFFEHSVPGRLDSSWMLFKPFLCSWLRHPSSLKIFLKIKSLAASGGKPMVGKTEPGHEPPWCSFVSFFTINLYRASTWTWWTGFMGICEKFWPSADSTSGQERVRGCKSQNSGICGSLCREHIVQWNFICGREEVFCLEHIELKMSSIVIYLMVKLFLFPLKQNREQPWSCKLSQERHFWELWGQKLAKNQMQSPSVEVGFHISWVIDILRCCFVRLNLLL